MTFQLCYKSILLWACFILREEELEIQKDLRNLSKTYLLTPVVALDLNQGLSDTKIFQYADNAQIINTVYYLSIGNKQY